MNRRSRRILTFILITYAVLFFLVFVLFPLIASAYPSTGQYFGYFPIVFFFPFFWGFGGGNKRQNSNGYSQNQGSNDMDAKGEYYNQNDFLMTDYSRYGDNSPWRYLKYVTVVLIVALGVALYFALR